MPKVIFAFGYLIGNPTDEYFGQIFEPLTGSKCFKSREFEYSHIEIVSVKIDFGGDVVMLYFKIFFYDDD